MYGGVFLMLKLYSYKVIGETPLLMHAPKLTQNEGPKRKEVPLPEVEAEMGAYRTAEGYLCFPAIAFRNALLKVAAQYRVGKKNLKSLLAHIRVPEEFVTLRDPDTWEHLRDYVIDARRAVVQKQGVIRHRSKLDRWACEVTFLADEEIAGRGLEKKLGELLNEAGQTVGVGDYRLEKGGWFGIFRVVE